MKPVCVTCMIDMEVLQIGAVLAEMATFGPVALWRCDVHRCTDCGCTVISQRAAEAENRGAPSELEALIKELDATPVYRCWLNRRERQDYRRNKCGASS